MTISYLFFINLKIFPKKEGVSFFMSYTYYKQENFTSKEGGIAMVITDVRIRKVNAEGKMKAIVSVTFDEEFVVHDIKVIEGQNGLFIAMPSRKMADGEFRDIAHPINATTRAKIQEAVFEEYEKSLATELATETE